MRPEVNYKTHNMLGKHIAASCTVNYEKAHYQGFILIPFPKNFTQYNVQNSSLKDIGMDFNASVHELKQILSPSLKYCLFMMKMERSIKTGLLPNKNNRVI